MADVWLLVDDDSGTDTGMDAEVVGAEVASAEVVIWVVDEEVGLVSLVSADVVGVVATDDTEVVVSVSESDPPPAALVAALPPPPDDTAAELSSARGKTAWLIQLA